MCVSHFGGRPDLLSVCAGDTTDHKMKVLLNRGTLHLLPPENSRCGLNEFFICGQHELLNMASRPHSVIIA